MYLCDICVLCIYVTRTKKKETMNLREREQEGYIGGLKRGKRSGK